MVNTQAAWQRVGGARTGRRVRHRRGDSARRGADQHRRAGRRVVEDDVRAAVREYQRDGALAIPMQANVALARA